MKPADRAWIVLAGGVFAYEAAAALTKWELLSEAVDRYRAKHPVITLGVICLLAAHLSRAIPRNLDPIHQAAARLR